MRLLLLLPEMQLRKVRRVLCLLHLLFHELYVKSKSRILFLQLAHFFLPNAHMHTVKLPLPRPQQTKTITACRCARFSSCSKADAADAAAAAKSVCCWPPTVAAAGPPFALSLSLCIPFVRGLQKNGKEKNIVTDKQFVHLFNGSFFCPLKGQDKRMATPGGGGAAAAAASTAAEPTFGSISRDLEALSRAKERELAQIRGEKQQAVDRAFQARMMKEQAVICIVLLLACCVTVL
jgi:hypothetical protein